MPPQFDLFVLFALLAFSALVLIRYIAQAWPFNNPSALHFGTLVPALGSPADRHYFGPDEGIYPVHPSIMACSHHGADDTHHHRRSDSGRPVLEDAGLPAAFSEHDPEMDRPYVPGLHTAPDNHMLAHGGLATANALHDGPAHSHDYHVSVTMPGDGMCVSATVKEWTVPCGVCESGDSDVFPALTAKFGADVHADVREQIRLHLERAMRMQYPEPASVSVR